MSQIVSLFVCESSRNPSSFLTAPMCLELAEKEFERRKDKLEDTKKSLLSQHQTKTIKTKLQQCNDDIAKLNSSKSDIIKEFIVNYFPMVMEKAVAASRHISSVINEFENCKEFTHQYDNGHASFTYAETLDARTLQIIKKWDKEQGNKAKKDFFADMNSIALDWYNIDTRALLGTEYDPLCS